MLKSLVTESIEVFGRFRDQLTECRDAYATAPLAEAEEKIFTLEPVFEEFQVQLNKLRSFFEEESGLEFNDENILKYGEQHNLPTGQFMDIYEEFLKLLEETHAAHEKAEQANMRN